MSKIGNKPNKKTPEKGPEKRSGKGHEKIAVILLNLGGPDKLESVRPFLYNLFSDKWIIRAPTIIRKCIALFISFTREKLAQSNYKLMGGKSPLLEETLKQSIALEGELQKSGLDCKVFVSMRYWHPFSSKVVQQIKDYGATKIILLPLYPQNSSSTTVSSFEDFEQELKKNYPGKVVKKIGCYFDDPGFIESHIKLIKEKLVKFDKKEKLRILFSAHSIPKKFVTSGDPYEWQINKTFAAITSDLEIGKYNPILCYQSKVGPIEWLKPSTEDEVERVAKEGSDILVVPVAFVSEHIETLVELDIEYKEIAEKYGVRYERVKALGVDKIFIKSLARYTQEAIISDKIVSRFSSSECPKDFKYCVCRN